MSDLDDQGATRDSRTIAYLKEGIARRDEEIKELKLKNRQLNEENAALKMIQNTWVSTL